jgi:hypothetical protein
MKLECSMVLKYFVSLPDMIILYVIILFIHIFTIEYIIKIVKFLLVKFYSST